MIKLLIGGSPCTFWSIAQKNNRETEASGMGWELFKNYLVAKEKFKPDLFLYENNKSASQAIKDQISKELGVDLMYINSALVSAQNRQRFYAFNWEVEQPEDRGVLLRDILETGEDLTKKEKAYALTATYGGAVPKNTIEKSQRTMVAEPVRVGDIGSTSQAHRVYSCDGKSVTINAGGGGQGGKTGLYATPFENVGDCEKVDAPTMRVTEATKQGYVDIEVGACVDLTFPNSKTRRGRSMKEKCNCLSQTITTGSSARQQNVLIQDAASGKGIIEAEKPMAFINKVYEVTDGLITIKDKQYPIKLKDGHYIIRKLTPIECERLQTLPDNYTAAVSNAQRYKGLGNGWTAEVIIHILNGALKDVPKDEEIVVLSMYDGIGTGRYCLDKMGFTNVKYFAYEIDRYAKQVAMSNYPDIIQMGDAFDLRNPDWTIGY